MNRPQTKDRRWRARLGRALTLVVGSYIFVLVMFATLQRSLLYPAQKSPPLPVAQFAMRGVNAVDVRTTTADGLVLNGWYFKPVETASDIKQLRPVILFLHGNGGNRVHRLDDVELLTDLGAEVLIFDYRGYGENEGAPTESGLAADARSMWAFAVGELDIDSQRLVLFGESLGGGVAVSLASEMCNRGRPPAGLVLRSTFSSMTEAASFHYPWLPISIALLDRYDSRSRIGNVTCPLISLHGDADRIVPLELGKRLFDAAPERSHDGFNKRFITLPGAGHNDVLDASRRKVQSAIASFLADLSQVPRK